MVKKFPARNNESNLKDIYELLSQIKKDLKVLEAKNPYSILLSSALESAIRKSDIAINRLAAEGFIDGLYISQVIASLKERDSNINSFKVEITKNEESCAPFPPYNIEVIGN